MLRSAKLAALRAASAFGVDRALLGSGWRARRLLILCYHGISLDDEHLWDSSLYMPQAMLRRRFEILREMGAAVLPFGDAIARLHAGTLPPRSVAITFDDGNYDFLLRVLPLIQEFRYPVTLYLTTYYSGYNRPVFDVACSYLLWKARGQALVWPEVVGDPVRLADGTRARTGRRIKDYAKARKLSGNAKDELLRELAVRIGIDYDALCARRMFHLVTADEARQLARAGVDIQLHTHRHRTSRERDLFWREIDENRAAIAAITPESTSHFCYPGGFYLPEFPEWLRERGVVSATTCEPGLTAPGTDQLLLPRLVDHTGLTEDEFRGWVSGVASWLPQRSHVMSEGQLLES